MDKVYDPKQVEKDIYQLWLDKGCFQAQDSSTKKAYCIVIPPPNITGALHLGHALNCTLQDILIRRKRMQGFNTLWLPGMDHAGIATQSVVERGLLEQEGKTRHDVGREELVRRIWAWKEQFGSRIARQLQLIGCSCDWDRERFTLDEVCAKAVRTTFVKFFEEGLIYRGKRLVNWDVQLQTAVADDEVFHETVSGYLWHIRYPLADGSGHLIVATTRPETMLGDTAVAVHPDDDRHKHLIGGQCILPLMDRELPIIADPILVDRAFGSGCVKVTPAHDHNDYQVGLRHDLEIINILNPDGTINENGGKYAGLDRFAARKKVVADLEKLGLIEKIEPYQTDIGHSDRSKTPIEPYLSDQWFVRMDKLSEQACELVRKEKIKFFPARYAKTYLDWLGERRDWCISRQLWWGHRVPIWHCNNRECYDPEQYAACEVGSTEVERGRRRFFFSSMEEPQSCPKCGQTDIEQDADVLDTWFSSALWPHSTLGWPEKTKALETFYPTDVLVTSRDIITLWVARMVMTGVHNTGRIPFEHVYIHSKILDGHGETMSKSKGNGVDPVDIVNRYGADALRFSLAYMATETQDVRMPVKKEKQPDGSTVNTSEKFDIGRNLCNKLWNATRFCLSNLADTPAGAWDPEYLELEDRWILHCLAQTIEQTDNAIQSYRFAEAAGKLYEFFWSKLCDWYMEIIKGRVQQKGPAGATARGVLATVLDHILRLFHPVIPFITEALWERLGEIVPERAVGQSGKLLVLSDWPKIEPDWKDPAAAQAMDLLQELVRAVRDTRSRHDVTPGKKVELIVSADGAEKEIIQANQEMICRLGHISGVRVQAEAKKPPKAASVIASAVQAFIPGIVDTAKELTRLQKQREQLLQRIASAEKKLNNSQFINRAKPEIVQRERENFAAAKTQIKVVNEQIEQTGAGDA
ncbi:MAG: valine--tRNA ligase [Actinobacteria bacterium]|nr:valine--tRNA ligase [Actinomycetota bacterium]